MYSIAYIYEVYIFYCWYNCVTKNVFGVYVKVYKYSV